MPLHDYQCPACGTVLFDQYRSVAEGAQARLPFCPACFAVQMAWVPQVGRMDSWDVNRAFTVLDGRNQKVRVDSLTKLRQIERESEVHARNGEGQKMVWRYYSQNRSNRLDHSYQQDPSLTPDPAAVRRLQIRRHGTAEPTVSFGPGVTDRNTSALTEG